MMLKLTWCMTLRDAMTCHIMLKCKIRGRQNLVSRLRYVCTTSTPSSILLHLSVWAWLGMVWHRWCQPEVGMVHPLLAIAGRQNLVSMLKHIWATSTLSFLSLCQSLCPWHGKAWHRWHGWMRDSMWRHDAWHHAWMRNSRKLKLEHVDTDGGYLHTKFHLPRAIRLGMA